MNRVRFPAPLPNRSNPPALYFLFRLSESIRLSRPLSKPKKTTPGAMFVSANASSRSTVNTAMANSPSITAGSTTRNSRRSEALRSVLPADENKNTGRQRQNTHHYRWNYDTGHQRHDPDQNEIDCQQQHTEIFRDVYHVSLSLGKGIDLSRRARFVTLKVR